MTNKCLRCGRPLKDPSKTYGSVCARKVAGAIHLLDGTIEVRDRKGDITAVIV